jgi:hypothetical protein
MNHRSRNTSPAEKYLSAWYWKTYAPGAIAFPYDPPTLAEIRRQTPMKRRTKKRTKTPTNFLVTVAKTG